VVWLLRPNCERPSCGAADQTKKFPSLQASPQVDAEALGLGLHAYAAAHALPVDIDDLGAMVAMSQFNAHVRNEVHCIGSVADGSRCWHQSYVACADLQCVSRQVSSLPEPLKEGDKKGHRSISGLGFPPIGADEGWRRHLIASKSAVPNVKLGCCLKWHD
jgi:hypothetical protein